MRIFGRDNDEILIMIILYYAKGNWSLPPSLETLSVFNHQNSNNLEMKRTVHAMVLNIVDTSPEVESSSNRKLMRKFIISRIVWKGTGWGLGSTCGRFWNLVSTYSLSCVKLSLTSALILLLMTSSSPAFRWYNRFFYYIMWQCNNFVTFEVMSSRRITWWWLTNTIPLIGFSMLELVQTV